MIKIKQGTKNGWIKIVEGGYLTIPSRKVRAGEDE